MPRHPIQPLETVNGVIRFKPNAIVDCLLRTGKLTMNDLASMPFSDEDRQQFAQLIGYSLSGYGELRSYVDTDAYNLAAKRATEEDERDIRIAYLEEQLAMVREALRVIVPNLFQVHPDDLRQ